MKKLISIGFLYDCTFISLFLLALFSMTAVSQTAPVLAFAIKDQFDSVRTEKEYLGTVTIIIGSDRGGSNYTGIWTKAISDSLGNNINDTQIKFLPVADVSSVPFFLKGFVKSKFPQERKQWILMDWKGYFTDTFQFVEDASNIVIIDKNGIFVYKTSGQTLDNQKLTTICNKIKELLTASP
jgi:hypothetical protein